MSFGSFPQTATYWAFTGNNGYGGKTFSTPVTLSVFWLDVIQKYTNENGEEKVSKSKVFLEQDVTVGSYLYLGTSAESSPYNVTGAYEIKSFSKIPSLDATEFERKALL